MMMNFERTSNDATPVARRPPAEFLHLGLAGGSLAHIHRLGGEHVKTFVIVALLMLPIAVPVKAQTQCCPFAGATNLTYSSSTGAVSFQPMSGQDAVPFSLAPSVSHPTQDIFDVFGNSAMTTKVLWVDASGNLNFAGNNATYGAQSQTTASYLRLYGGYTSPTNAGAYLDFWDYSATHRSVLYADPLTAGQMSIETSVHSGAATVNNVICTHGNGQCSGGSGTVTSVGLSMPLGFTVSSSPVTTTGTLSVGGPLTNEGDLPYYHSSAWARLGVGASGKCLTSNGTDPLWGSCGGSASVTSVGISLPAQFQVSQSPVTTSGTLTGVWATLGTQVTGDPNFPAIPALLQRRSTLLLASGGDTLSGMGDSIYGTGTTLTAASPSASFPDARITIPTGTTAHTAVGFAGSPIYRTGLNSNGSAGIFFDARADMNGATANYHAFLGVTDQTVATTMAGTSNDCKYKGIYAAISACTDGAYTTAPAYASTHWVCVTNNADGNASNQSATDSGVAFDGNEHRFAIWEDVANAKWHFYIDGAQVCGTGVAANYLAATNLRLEYGATNTTTTAVTLGAAGFQVFSN